MLTRETLGELVDELAGRPASKRGKVPGIKPDRGDVILGAALVLASVMDSRRLRRDRGHRGRPARGRLLRALPRGRPPRADRRRPQAVGGQPRAPLRRQRRSREACRAPLTRALRRARDAGLLEPSAGDRELLARACALHDIGVAVDYDDHHKHSRYLILSSGLPGFDQRELELISLIAQYHRKGDPTSAARGAGARRRPGAAGAARRDHPDRRAARARPRPDGARHRRLERERFSSRPRGRRCGRRGRDLVGPARSELLEGALGRPLEINHA